jgi:hypothetical protein
MAAASVRSEDIAAVWTDIVALLSIRVPPRPYFLTVAARDSVRPPPGVLMTSQVAPA